MALEPVCVGLALSHASLIRSLPLSTDHSLIASPYTHKVRFTTTHPSTQSLGQTCRRFRGASPVYPTPRNREIGFVSSSFSFRACRACERGEAVRAHVERYPYRWASRVLGSTCCPCPVLLAPIFCGQARWF